MRKVTATSLLLAEHSASRLKVREIAVTEGVAEIDIQLFTSKTFLELSHVAPIFCCMF